MQAQSLPRTGRLFLPRSPRVLAAFSDEKLVEQVRRGNEAAFEVVYDRHHRGILSFCRHMLSSPEEAEDAVQQTFISAYDSMRADARDIKLKAWLYTIARNRCLSILRARRERPAEIDDVATAGLSEEVQQRSDLRELLADLHELPVDQRAALVLSELGDLSHAEVGTIVGCEPAKVKSLVFQARSSLIETRRAREIPCQEIREQLATASGGALRRGPLRRHLKTCEGCAEFRDEVRSQRRALAALLPVIPTVGLKESALAAIGFGGGGGAGGMIAGGGLSSLLGSTAAVKAVAVVAAAGLAVGTGLVLEENDGNPDAAAAAGQRDTPAPVGIRDTAAGPGVGTVVRMKHRDASGGAAVHGGPVSRPAHGRSHGRAGTNPHRGGRGRGTGPGTGRGGNSAPAQTPAAGSVPGSQGSSNAGGNGHGNSGGRSGTHTNSGNHTGWEIGVGNPHRGSAPPAHNPAGHAQPTPAPHAGTPQGTAHGNGNGGGNGGSKGERSVGGIAVPAVPEAPKAPPNVHIPQH